jgi:hypothetical protein
MFLFTICFLVGEEESNNGSLLFPSKNYIKPLLMKRKIIMSFLNLKDRKMIKKIKRFFFTVKNCKTEKELRENGIWVNDLNQF